MLTLPIFDDFQKIEKSIFIFYLIGLEAFGGILLIEASPNIIKQLAKRICAQHTCT